MTYSHLVRKNLAFVGSHLRIPFFQNAYALIALQASTAILGYLFWMLVTRLFTPEQVGVGTAIYSAVMLLVGAAGLGLDDGLAYYLPRVKEPNRLVDAYFSLTAVVGVTLACVFLAGQKVWSPRLSIVGTSTLSQALFVGSTLILVVSTMQDSLFVAERVSTTSLFKGLLVNLIRFPLLYLVVFFKEWGLLLSATSAALIGVGVYIHKYQKTTRPAYRFNFELSPTVWKPVVSYSLGNYITNVLVALPNTLLPLIVLNQLGATSNAYFYAAWMLASVINVIGRSFGVSILVESGREPQAVAQNAVRALIISTVVLLPTVLGISALAYPLLTLLGKNYGAAGTLLVVQLAISTIPLTFHGIALGTLKARGRVKELILASIIFTLLHLALSVWFASLGGLLGVGNAIIVARSISALMTFFLAFGDKWWAWLAKFFSLPSAR